MHPHSRSFGALGKRTVVLLGLALASWIQAAPAPQIKQPGASAAKSPRPLKVFILAGQSNMQGHAKVETFDYIGDDPATAPLLREMRDSDGNPRVCDNVWISSIGCLGDAYSDLTERTGKLTVGFGAPEGKIGPEFTFGIFMEKLLGEPILLIKTAWGGRSLHTDFRPPSAGPYQPTAEEAKKWAERPERKAKIDAATGVFYREMVAHVKRVLADPKRVYPGYDDKHGYEIAGFVWLQGFNDLVSGDTYPKKPGARVQDYSNYSQWLADLIRDVRKDLAAPRLPVIIGVLGVDGLNASENTKAFRAAMAAPASMPEFVGTVKAVETAPFWSQELGTIAEKKEKVSQMAYLLESKNKKEANADGSMTKQQQRAYVKDYEAKLITPAEAAMWKRGASNGGYHYLGCAKTFALMGKAFAEALVNPTGISKPAAPAQARTPIPAAIPREIRDISGWQVLIQTKLLETERNATEHALGLLQKMLDEIVRVVPPTAVKELRQIPLYFSPAYQPSRTGAEYHPDAGWLRANGRDPMMARAVEFSGVADFEKEMNRMPNFVLHELAHGYHDRVLQDGFSNASIQAAFERAKAGGKYELVERWFGNGKPNTRERAYAMTNPMEYFAEATEAYFVRNDFFPFTRDELKLHDPEMLALLEKLWTKP